MSKDKPNQNTRTSTSTPDEQNNTLPAGFSIGTVKGRHYPEDKVVTQGTDGKQT